MTTIEDDIWRKFHDLSCQRPDLWAKCYPKAYEGINGGEYYSAKLVGYFLLCTAVKIEQPEVHLYTHFNATVETIWASRLAAYHVPIFWLGRELTEALKLTRLPVTLDCTTMKLPFEAAVFMLPKGSLKYQSEANDVIFVSYARAATEEQIPSVNPRIATSLVGRGDFTVLAGMRSGRLLNWSHPWEEPLDIAQLDSTIEELPNRPNETRFQCDITTDDKKFMARVSHLVFNTLQLMLARPNLVSMGSLAKRVHSKKATAKEFWSPNVIGKGYRLKRESEPLGGTHSSPRGHWVRGFWRDQVCGPKYSQRREAWIEPFWRGGSE